MRLLSFEIDGGTRVGLLKDDFVYPLSADYGGTAIKSLLTDGLQLRPAELRIDGRPISLTDVKFLPVVPDPGKIVAVGINYEEHRRETQREPSARPIIFARFADSQVGHQQPIVKPRISDELDFEGELAVIIGRHARYIAPENALSCVAGYSIYNDGSVRDWQRHTNQYTPGKNFPATGAFGPWLVTADEIPDPQNLLLETRLNGEIMQSCSTAEMIFSVAEIIAYASQFSVLAPGDVIITGTPAGVGTKRKPPVYMKDGDRIEVGIERIGTLSNPVMAER